MSAPLLEKAEAFREQRHLVAKQLAYTAPELVPDSTKQWLAATEAVIDLVDYVAASDDPVLIEKTERFADALLNTVN